MTALWADLASWWNTVRPDFAFLVALPFFVAAVALLSDKFFPHRGPKEHLKKPSEDVEP